MLFGYTWYEVFLYFLIYSFLGWCTEVCFAAVTTGKLVNRGFLNGPVCPIYGFGMLAVLACLTPAGDNAALLFLGGMLLTSLIELVGGWVLYKAYHTRWWDYSDRPFNLGGFICLEFSILWGLGTVLILRVVHPAIAAAAMAIPHKAGWIIMALLYCLYAADLIVTLFVVAGLNRDLEALNAVAGNLREVSDALTNLVGTTALTADQKLDEGRLQLTLAKAEASDKVDEVKDAAYDALHGVKSTAQTLLTDVKASTLDLVGEDGDGNARAALARLEQSKAELEQRAEALRRDVLNHPLFGGARLLRAFPEMSSTRYREALEELKKRLPHKEK